jgi:hypothetical protein
LIQGTEKFSYKKGSWYDNGRKIIGASNEEIYSSKQIFKLKKLAL